jgi:hypothetical protein
MAETRVPPRPRQATVAGVMAAVGCGLLVLVLFDQMSRVRSLETRESLSRALSQPPWAGSGIGVAQALDVLHGVLLLSGALAAAGCVLGVYALRRHRGARVGLTVVAVLLMFSAVFVAGFLPVLVAIGAGMLWGRDSRAWFDGRVLEPRPQAPPVPAPASPDEMASWPAPAPHDRHDPSPSPWSSAVPATEAHRPGVVTAALAVTWSSCALVAIGLVLVMVRGLVDKDGVYREVTRSDAASGLADSPNAVLEVLLIACVVLLLWCLSVAALAVPAAQRVGWARLALVGNAGLVGLLSLPVLVAVPVVGLLLLAASVSVVVLLLLPPANAWYARRPTRPRTKPPAW